MRYLLLLICIPLFAQLYEVDCKDKQDTIVTTPKKPVHFTLTIGNHMGIDYGKVGIVYNFECLSVYSISTTQAKIKKVTLIGEIQKGGGYNFQFERACLFGGFALKIYYTSFGIYLGYENSALVKDTFCRNTGKITVGGSVKF